MGGLEDNEPPLKRVKETQRELNSFLGNSSCCNSTAYSLGDQMAQSLSSQGDDMMVGTKGVIRKQEYVKIITRALYSLGYDKSGALLEEESGIQLHSSIVSLFMQQMLDGKWDESVMTLHKIGISDETLKSASFVILEQKFLELLQREKTMEALTTLRNEIVPLQINSDRVPELAACIFNSQSKCASSNECANPRSQILDRLQKLLPASIIIPERRLEHLVEQALDIQHCSCAFHNTLDDELSLYTDHQCGKSQIPSRTLQVLQAHNDEVWYLQFSHNGKYLASASKDESTIIWEVREDGKLYLKHKLVGHQTPVSTLSWSPDDKQLLTCGLEDVVRRWDINSGECLQVYEKQGLGLVSCEWFPDGEGVISGVTDKSICFWDLDGIELEWWKGQRTLKISDMAITSDGKKILTICRDSTIVMVDREAKFETLIEEDQVITSFSLSKDNRFLLIDLLNQEIHLWSIEDGPKVISKYKGHKRSRFLLHSCFGGFEQSFIASGSEDSQVYIWQRATGELLSVLPGHSGAVNCMSWNPTNPHMLASASDDRTIRIWGLKQMNMKLNGAHSNGVIPHQNGNA
ncbi:hypothetical protein V2J09_020453 [Rumex salicifolius]